MGKSESCKKSNMTGKIKRQAFIFLLIATALSALAAALSEGVYSNFYSEVYNATAAQRGFIEFPRELPGLIAVIVISMLSFLGEIRLAIIAQLLTILGLLLLGIFTPPFGIMLIFLFINSMGMHLYIPLKDGISLNIIGDENTGRKFGILNGVRNAAGLFGGIIVFVGFRFGFFSFQHTVIRNFLIATVFFAAVVLILLILRKMIGDPPISTGKGRFLFRKEYKFYYAMASLHGAHKQVAYVFGPWVLITILLRQADRMALLSMIGLALGIVFMPAVGWLADRLGLRRMLLVEGFSFITIYILFGVFTAGLMNETVAVLGIPIFFFLYALLILDRMTMQLGMIRSLYLRSIAKDKSEITPTLSTGMSIDHAISILCAFLGGLVWDAWGPQYVFFIAATLALLNVFVASRLPKVVPTE